MRTSSSIIPIQLDHLNALSPFERVDSSLSPCVKHCGAASLIEHSFLCCCLEPALAREPQQIPDTPPSPIPFDHVHYRRPRSGTSIDQARSSSFILVKYTRTALQIDTPTQVVEFILRTPLRREEELGKTIALDHSIPNLVCHSSHHNNKVHLAQKCR